MTADVIAWLRSPEGEAWSRNRVVYLPSNPPSMRRDGPVNPSEDPTGRPPLNAEEWARLEREQLGIGRTATRETG